MGLVSKGKLLFNTIKYLKPVQIRYQVLNRLMPREDFRKYKKTGIAYKDYSLWIGSLDDDSAFIERFLPERLLANELTLLNETREFKAWLFLDASHLWNFNVHYLEYLVPLCSLGKSTGDQKYKEKINEILNRWYESGSKEMDSNQAYTISLRLVNMFLLSDAINERDKLYEYIYAQYCFLLKHQEKHLLGNHYLENLKAIVICSVVFGEEDIYRRYIKLFLRELDEQITSDGLHFELSLMYHKIVLEDIMRVAIVLRQAQKIEYQEVVSYIDKMATALFSLEYGINRTPLFNDAGDNVAKPTKALLETVRKEFDIQPELKSNVAGYYKLYDGKVALIIDCGEIGPKYMSGHAHCDCLSFELFYDGKPVFVNSGTYQYQGEYRKYFKSTLAHNTVVINDKEQSELWGEHRVGRRISNVRVKNEGNEIIGAYTNYYGETHMRILKLNNNKIEVVDRITGNGKSYLHLAPGLKYSNGRISGDDIEITISAMNADVAVETMLYSESFGMIEETECLVFSWTSGNENHGYKIEFFEGENK